LASCRKPLWINVEVWHADHLGLQLLGLVDRIQRNRDVFPAKVINGLIHDDACQSRRKARIRTEVREIPERAQIRLLQHVFGFGVVADDCPRDPRRCHI